MNIAKLIAEFLDCNPRFSVNTTVAYRRDIRVFLDRVVQNRPNVNIASITSEDVDDYMANLYDSGMRPSSLQRHLCSLRTFFGWATTVNLLATNPTSTTRISWSNPPTSKRHLTTAEMSRLCEAPVGDAPRQIRDRAMLALLCTGALRASQLTNLKTDDIDSDQGLIFLRNQYGGKTPVSLPSEFLLHEKLRAYLNRARPHFLIPVPSELRQKNQVVFLTVFGREMTRQSFWKIVKRYARVAGLQPVGPDDIYYSVRE